MSRRHSHCGWCGAAFVDDKWPRVCPSCAQTTYRNPTPVAVLVLPIATDDGGRGVLAIRRGVDDGKGQLALPGGYVDFGETWQQACARELGEETGVRIDAGDVSLVDVHSAANGTLLIFGRGPTLPASSLPPFSATSETTERLVLLAPVTLAFSLHTLVLANHFRGAAPG
jgi:8-oxo-dGTP pyrophosphatase MutT (NUDIX family)